MMNSDQTLNNNEIERIENLFEQRQHEEQCKIGRDEVWAIYWDPVNDDDDDVSQSAHWYAVVRHVENDSDDVGIVWLEEQKDDATGEPIPGHWKLPKEFTADIDAYVDETQKRACFSHRCFNNYKTVLDAAGTIKIMPRPNEVWAINKTGEYEYDFWFALVKRRLEYDERSFMCQWLEKNKDTETNVDLFVKNEDYPEECLDRDVFSHKVHMMNSGEEDFWLDNHCFQRTKTPARSTPAKGAKRAKPPMPGASAGEGQGPATPSPCAPRPADLKAGQNPRRGPRRALTFADKNDRCMHCGEKEAWEDLRTCKHCKNMFHAECMGRYMDHGLYEDIWTHGDGSEGCTHVCYKCNPKYKAARVQASEASKQASEQAGASACMGMECEDDGRADRVIDMRINTSKHGKCEYLVERRTHPGVRCQDWEDAPDQAMIKAFEARILHRGIGHFPLNSLYFQESRVRRDGKDTGVVKRVYRLSTNGVSFGVHQYSNVFTREEILSFEDELRERWICDGQRNKTIDPGVVVDLNKNQTRKKLFYCFAYLYGEEARVGTSSAVKLAKEVYGTSKESYLYRLKDGEGNEACLPDFLGKISEAIIARCGLESFAPNMAVCNLYKSGVGISVHKDSDEHFERPIVSLRLFSDSVLSFGSKGQGCVSHPVKSYEIPLRVGDVTIMGGFAANNVKHCIKAKHHTTDSASIMLRRIKPKAKVLADNLGHRLWMRAKAAPEQGEQGEAGEAMPGLPADKAGAPSCVTPPTTSNVSVDNSGSERRPSHELVPDAFERSSPAPPTPAPLPPPTPAPAPPPPPPQAVGAPVGEPVGPSVGPAAVPLGFPMADAASLLYMHGSAFAPQSFGSDNYPVTSSIIQKLYHQSVSQ